MLWIRVGALLMALGIVFGAFGAHGLKDTLTPESMAVFKTGVLYQMLNALGLLLVGALDVFQPETRSKRFPCAAFLTAGIVLFSGSLYLISLCGLTGVGIVTPIGGFCLAAGWIFLVFTA